MGLGYTGTMRKYHTLEEDMAGNILLCSPQGDVLQRFGGCDAIEQALAWAALQGWDVRAVPKPPSPYERYTFQLLRRVQRDLWNIEEIDGIELSPDDDDDAL